MEFDRSEVIKTLSKALEVDINELSQIGDDDDIRPYGLDSIKGIQAVVMIEGQFNIEIVDEDLLLENFNTINKIKKIIEKYS
jgi:acyl carrier protein